MCVRGSSHRAVRPAVPACRVWRAGNRTPCQAARLQRCSTQYTVRSTQHAAVQQPQLTQRSVLSPPSSIQQMCRRRPAGMQDNLLINFRVHPEGRTEAHPEYPAPGNPEHWDHASTTPSPPARAPEPRAERRCCGVCPAARVLSDCGSAAEHGCPRCLRSAASRVICGSALCRVVHGAWCMVHLVHLESKNRERCSMPQGA